MVHIAIIGGGIGGLTTALALQQAGLHFDVFEQAPELLDVGAAIAIWPNAMRILQHLGIAEKVIERAGVMNQIRWVDQHGRLLNEVSIADRRCPPVALHRADLQGTLVEALPASSIHLGKRFVEYFQKTDGISATFEEIESRRALGRPRRAAPTNTFEADLLLAADGIHSSVRSQLLNDGEPIFRGYTVWRGISAIVPDRIPDHTAIEFHGRGKRFGLGPVGLGRIGWWASANGNYEHARDDLLSLFKDWALPVVQLIEATPASSILRTAATDRPANRNWGTGRVTLLGDAIHPTTPNLGQGGCLAMEDAMALTSCLKKYGVGEEALREYERARYKRTAAIAFYSRLYGSAGQWENIIGRALRRTALSLIPEATARRLMRTVFYPQVSLI
jgi:2-polyprenyl-6-methoxyphenol hydroxylase-like FAD-dependent oxidoreductase